MENLNWFDAKYKNKPVASLEDRAELFKQFFESKNIKINDGTNENRRTKREVKQI